MRKLHSCAATWHTIGNRERSVVICLVHATGKRGYDVFVGGSHQSGAFGQYITTVERAPSELQLGIWAQNLLTTGRMG